MAQRTSHCQHHVAYSCKVLWLQLFCVTIQKKYTRGSNGSMPAEDLISAHLQGGEVDERDGARRVAHREHRAHDDLSGNTSA